MAESDWTPMPAGAGLTSREALALKALRAAEWTSIGAGNGLACPCCRYWKPDHADCCLLKQALDALTGKDSNENP